MVASSFNQCLVFKLLMRIGSLLFFIKFCYIIFYEAFIKNIVIGILIFFLLASLYSILSGQLIKLEEISLSALVEEIKKGEVEKISVKGERLEILLVSKKEQF